MEVVQTSKGPLALQTSVAMVLALVVYLVVATVTGVLIFLIQWSMTVIRPGIIQFFAATTGSVAGMAAAKGGCDSVLRGYSRRAVFVMFAILTVAALAMELFIVPMQLNQINSLGQLVAGTIAAYVCFWQDA